MFIQEDLDRSVYPLMASSAHSKMLKKHILTTRKRILIDVPILNSLMAPWRSFPDIRFWLDISKHTLCNCCDVASLPFFSKRIITSRPVDTSDARIDLKAIFTEKKFRHTPWPFLFRAGTRSYAFRICVIRDKQLVKWQQQLFLLV